jgi:glucose dehydrogenase
MRDIMMRDMIAHALARGEDPAAFRTRFRDVWRSSLDLWFIVEPQPDPSHTLSIERIEPNGQAVPRIALRYPPYFGECVERVMTWVQRRLPRGTVKHLGSIPTAFHWLGATRMSRSAGDGCVDPTLRYHELDNLYILSTSVFPSASSANPTLTLGALALRLGDHLGRRGQGSRG